MYIAGFIGFLPSTVCLSFLNIHVFSLHKKHHAAETLRVVLRSKDPRFLCENLGYGLDNIGPHTQVVTTMFIFTCFFAWGICYKSKICHYNWEGV